MLNQIMKFGEKKGNQEVIDPRVRKGKEDLLVAQAC
jgi:hypothetical protein